MSGEWRDDLEIEDQEKWMSLDTIVIVSLLCVF